MLALYATFTCASRGTSSLTLHAPVVSLTLSHLPRAPFNVSRVVPHITIRLPSSATAAATAAADAGAAAASTFGFSLEPLPAWDDCDSSSESSSLSVTKNLINLVFARSRFWNSILASGAAGASEGSR